MIHQLKTQLFTLFVIYQNSEFCGGSCSLPVDFKDNWWDSRTNAVITISSLQVTSGWEITINQETFSTYTCIHSTDTHWVFRSNNTIHSAFGNKVYAVLCLEYTKVTDNSYVYYLKAAQNPIINNERIFLPSSEEVAVFTSIAHYCPLENGPDAREFDVLVKQNTQAMIHNGQYLPDPLLGVFDYTVTDSSGTTCSEPSVWGGCYSEGNIDRTTITLNNTLCSTAVFGSTYGVFYKVAHVFHIDTYYVILINANGTDTLFTCIAVKETGNIRSLSTNPGGCAAGQVATSRTSDSNSQLITLTAYDTCLFSPSSGTNSSSGTTALVIGIIVMFLTFIFIAMTIALVMFWLSLQIIMILLFKKLLQNKQTQNVQQTYSQRSMDTTNSPYPESKVFLSEIHKSGEQGEQKQELIAESTSTANIGNPDVMKPNHLQWIQHKPQLTPLTIKPIEFVRLSLEAKPPLPSIHKSKSFENSVVSIHR